MLDSSLAGDANSPFSFPAPQPPASKDCGGRIVDELPNKRQWCQNGFLFQ